MEKKPIKTDRVWNFSRANAPISKKQKIFLSRLIETTYIDKPTMQKKLFERINHLSVIQSHFAIQKLLQKKPMEMAM